VGIATTPQFTVEIVCKSATGAQFHCPVRALILQRSQHFDDCRVSNLMGVA
jgi:hypothetical protein